MFFIYWHIYHFWCFLFLLCRSKFSPTIIFLDSEEFPLIFLVLQVNYHLIISAFTYLKHYFNFIFELQLYWCGILSWKFYFALPPVEGMLKDLIEEFISAMITFVFLEYPVDSITKNCLAWGKSKSNRNS